MCRADGRLDSDQGDTYTALTTEITVSPGMEFAFSLVATRNGIFIPDSSFMYAKIIIYNKAVSENIFLTVKVVQSLFLNLENSKVHN